MGELNQTGLTTAELRRRDRDHFMQTVKQHVDMMDAEQLKEIRDYVIKALDSEAESAVGGLVAAFDVRPACEAADVTAVTREAALNLGKQFMGWEFFETEGEKHDGPEDAKSV